METKFQKVERLRAAGSPVADACKKAGIGINTYYKYKKAAAKKPAQLAKTVAKKAATKKATTNVLVKAKKATRKSYSKKAEHVTFQLPVVANNRMVVLVGNPSDIIAALGKLQ